MGNIQAVYNNDTSSEQANTTPTPQESPQDFSNLILEISKHAEH